MFIQVQTVSDDMLGKMSEDGRTNEFEGEGIEYMVGSLPRVIDTEGIIVSENVEDDEEGNVECRAVHWNRDLANGDLPA